MTNETAAISTNDERAMRRAKRQSLIDEGVNPYPIASHVNAHVADLSSAYAGLEAGGVDDRAAVYTLAGRIRAKRGRGRGGAGNAAGSLGGA